MQRWTVVLWFAGIFFATAPAMAQETEKFALLVGVNDQAQTEGAAPVSVLVGPGNDVVLMKDLLVKTYGFKDDAAHIRVLTGRDATRKNIAEAFQQQLIDNARQHPGAVVVFYNSGHGSFTADLNQDEGDGVDETLVAYDSRAPGGRDIVDDEIESWFEALRAHTSNITFIADTCHSGTVTRGDVARGLPPNPNMPLPPAGRGTTPGGGDLLRNQQYVTAAASLANELSYENAIPAAGGRQHGFFTWHLAQTLSQRPRQSWRRAMVDVARAVTSMAPQQHPNVEGDTDRLVFGGVDSREEPYIAIGELKKRGRFTIQAGRAQGVVGGALLAVYAAEAQTLRGDEHKIATAHVIDADAGGATAEILGKPQAELTQDAKVVLLTPYAGTEPLQVQLDSLADQPTADADRRVLASVRKLLAENRLIKAVGSDRPWSIAVQRGCRQPQGGVQAGTAGSEANCDAVYYVAGRQTREPLMAFSVGAGETDVASRLAQAIAALGRQAGLRGLSNEGSGLDVSFRLLNVTTRATAGGGLEVESALPAPEGRVPVINIGDYFTFSITNNAQVPVWVALVSLGTSGSIALMSRSSNGDEVLPGKTVRLYPPLQAGAPAGLETYKIVAVTRGDVDFSVLTQPGSRSKSQQSPLERYLAQTTTTGKRDPQTAANVKLNEWMTAATDIVVATPAEPCGQQADAQASAH